MSLHRLHRIAALVCCATPLVAQTTTQTTSQPTTQPAAPLTIQTAPRDPAEARLQEALRQRDAIIRNLLQRVEDLELRVNGAVTQPPRVMTAAKAEARPASKAPAPIVDPAAGGASSSVFSVVTNAGYDTDERRASEALDQALLVRGGLLLPPGTLEFDNTLSYFTASSDHVNVNGFALLPILVVGDITSQRVRRDILLPTFTTRLGLPHRFQLDLTVPYGYELNRTVNALNEQTSSSNFGLGDIQGSVSRQIFTEHGRIPDMLANVRFKSRTGSNSFDLQSSQTSLGSGFYGLQGNLTAAKSSDPVVFYGNLSYTANLPATHLVSTNDPANPDAKVPGHFNPGDAVGFQLGSILALNPETSMTLGWDQRFTRVTTLNGTAIPASYLVEGSLRVGTSYLYAPGKTVDLSFGVGLTPDTPNLQFSIGFPFRASLWKPKPTVH